MLASPLAAIYTMRGWQGEPVFEKDIELKLDTIVPRPRRECRY